MYSEEPVVPCAQDDARTSYLEQLTAQIWMNGSKLSRYLESNGHRSPSFERDGPAHVLPSNAPDAAHVLRHQLKEDATRLFRLASGPNEYVSHIALNVRKPHESGHIGSTLTTLTRVYSMPPMAHLFSHILYSP